VLSQPVAARIVRLTAAPGDHVTKGQVLARIDLLSMKAELARALSELAAAEAAALEASISLERAQRRRMFPPLDGSDSGGEAIQDVAMGRAMAAAAKVASREAAYLVARQRVVGGVVRAPEDGVILAREVDEGQTVPAGAALFRLAPDAQSLHLTVSVPESDLARLSVGQVARFAVPAYPGRVFTGKVVRLLPLAGPETARRLPVVIAVEHDAADLRAGMTASATIDTPTSGPVLRVPTAALLFAPRGMSASLDDPAVWISDPAGARLVRTPVEVGAVDGTFAEVRGQGLAEGTGVAVGHALTSRPEAAP
jgi:HlyD family secretion protein